MGLFDDIQAKVQTSISDFENVGLPALEAQAETSAIGTLTTMQQNATKTAQASVTDILNRPSDPNSFISQLLKNTIQSPALKTYGPYIVGALIIAGVAGAFVFGSKK